MTRMFALIALALALAATVTARASNCFAFVEGVPWVRYAALGDLVARAGEVTITYVT